MHHKEACCVQVTGEDSDDLDPWTRREEEEDEGVMEYFVLQESTGYMAPALRFLAVMHTLISFLCVLGYYYLKVLITHQRCVCEEFTGAAKAPLLHRSGAAGGVQEREGDRTQAGVRWALHHRAAV